MDLTYFIMLFVCVCNLPFLSFTLLTVLNFFAVYIHSTFKWTCFLQGWIKYYSV